MLHFPQPQLQAGAGAIEPRHADEAAGLCDGLRGQMASGHVGEGRGGWHAEDDAGGLWLRLLLRLRCAGTRAVCVDREQALRRRADGDHRGSSRRRRDESRDARRALAQRFGGTGLEVRGLPFHHRRQGGCVADETVGERRQANLSSSTTPSPRLMRRGRRRASSKARAARGNTATM